MSELESLRRLAVETAGRAYAPYSRFHVGAALQSASGRIYTGCNVENAALPIGGCAERAAIAAAVAAEGAGFRLVAIAVAARAEDGRAMPVSPCGACRQALVEFGAEARVSFRQPDEEWVDVVADELLPWRFVLPKV